MQLSNILNLFSTGKDKILTYNLLTNRQLTVKLKRKEK